MSKKIIPLLLALGLFLNLGFASPVFAGPKTSKKTSIAEQKQKKVSIEKRNEVRRAVEAVKRSSGECPKKGKCLILDEELLEALHAAGDKNAVKEFQKAIQKKKALMKKRVENPSFEVPYEGPLKASEN